VADTIEVTLRLRGGHHYRLAFAEDDPEVERLRRVRQSVLPGRAGVLPALLQLPLACGREALTFSVADILELRVPRPDHPALNNREGHLGGYISARHPRAAALGVEHGDSATWSPLLWRWIVEELAVTSVLDVGCGEGHGAGFFREQGCDVLGVDGSVEALRDSVIPDRHVRHDYASGPYRPGRDFDLVWSCEFVEHVEERYCENFLASFDSAARYLFMTAAPPGQVGWHHVNCQPSGYWIEKIEPRGFRFSRSLTRRARAIVEHGHFANTGLVFERLEPPISA